MTNKKKFITQLRGQDASITGNRLAAAFHLDGRSQMECANATGLTPQYISNVKNGRFQNLTLDNLHLFASFFGCAIEDLFPSREELAS
jgi:transcriptional regulator with XRE-family HTH domain